MIPETSRVLNHLTFPWNVLGISSLQITNFYWGRRSLFRANVVSACARDRHCEMMLSDLTLRWPRTVQCPKLVPHPQIRDQALLQGHHLIAQTCLGRHPHAIVLSWHSVAWVLRASVMWFTMHVMQVLLGNWNLSAHCWCSIQCTLAWCQVAQGCLFMFILLASLFVANPTPQSTNPPNPWGRQTFLLTRQQSWDNFGAIFAHSTPTSPLGLSSLSFLPKPPNACHAFSADGWERRYRPGWLHQCGMRLQTKLPHISWRGSVESNPRLVILHSAFKELKFLWLRWNWYGILYSY